LTYRRRRRQGKKGPINRSLLRCTIEFGKKPSLLTDLRSSRGGEAPLFKKGRKKKKQPLDVRYVHQKGKKREIAPYSKGRQGRQVRRKMKKGLIQTRQYHFGRDCGGKIGRRWQRPVAGDEESGEIQKCSSRPDERALRSHERGKKDEYFRHQGQRTGGLNLQHLPLRPAG